MRNASGDESTPRAGWTAATSVAVVVLMILLGSLAIVSIDRERHQEQVRNALRNDAQALDAATEQALVSHGAITQALGALVDDRGEVDETAFRQLAQRLLNVRDGVRALELAPGGVITYVHPTVGNEQAVGLDLNNHPSGSLALEELRERSSIIVEGPINLAQGGRAVIIRARVDVPGPTPTSPPRFWGVAIDVVDMQALLRQIGLDERRDLRWGLTRGEGAVATTSLILGEDLSGLDPVTTSIDVPGGNWTLAVAPRAGWPTNSPNTGYLIGAGLFLALAVGLLAGRFASEPARLRGMVQAAAAELDESHARTRGVMNSVADAILAADAAGQVIDWNPAARRLLRVDETTRDHVRLEHHLDLDRVTLVSQDDGVRLGRATLRVTRADGSVFPAAVTVAQREGSTFRTITIRDVSDAHRREDDLRRHVLELERLRQEHDAIDALKRDFMAMASHEVRTPITAIRGFALTLNRHWDQLADEDRRRSLDVIHRQATRLWHVVSDVLTTSQLEGGDLASNVAPVHLRTTIADAVTEAQVPPGDVLVDCPEPLTARLDASHLTRILVALLTNAHKYGSAPIAVTATTDGSDLVLRVTDHGPGVPVDFRPQLFEPFSQASTGVTREAIGTGLGLSVARGLARASGGDVWHEQREGVGAVFAVRLPRADVVTRPKAPLLPQGPDADPAVPTTLKIEHVVDART